jgi:uncharacterized protein
MQYSVGRMGRVFALRLEQGDRLPDIIEEFVARHEILRGAVFLLGGADDKSRLVVGPEGSAGHRITPMFQELSGIHEMLAMGTIFPNEAGQPVLHLHAAAGRAGNALVGCARAGVGVWLVGEVIIMEFEGLHGSRRIDPHSGFELLQLPKESWNE